MMLITSNYCSFGLVKKETRKFYVDSVIKFRVFSELLQESTLLVRYKLNILWPPWVNQFDIRALLFRSLSGFIPLDKTVLYGYLKPAFRQFIFIAFLFDIVSVV